MPIPRAIKRHLLLCSGVASLRRLNHSNGTETSRPSERLTSIESSVKPTFLIVGIFNYTSPTRGDRALKAKTAGSSPAVFLFLMHAVCRRKILQTQIGAQSRSGSQGYTKPHRCGLHTSVLRDSKKR